ncbi:uncharacterized protein ACWYII_006158 isoform 1-T1 [Salvelinus alpinus]
MPSEEEMLKDRKRRRKQNTLQDVEDVPPKKSQHVTSASSSAGSDDTENKMHGELGAVNCEADVLLRDTLEAARWCERQTFKGTVSLPSVIGMDGEDRITTLKELRLYDGLDEEENILLKEPFMFSFQLQR